MTPGVRTATMTASDPLAQFLEWQLKQVIGARKEVN